MLKLGGCCVDDGWVEILCLGLICLGFGMSFCIGDFGSRFYVVMSG